MNKEFIRREELEDAFLDMHGFKPKVERMRISGNEYSIRISYNGKVVILTERLEKGLTKDASAEYSGDTTGFKSMYAAECFASGILRG